MKNKILIELVVPDIDEIYNVYIPINKRIGNIIILLAKAVSEFNLGEFEENNHNCLYDGETGQRYTVNELVRNTNIRNGSRLILM